MATDHYVDPDWTGANSGSIEEPWTDLDSFTLASNDTIYLRKGSRTRLTTPLLIESLSNVNVFTYEPDEILYLASAGSYIDNGFGLNLANFGTLVYSRTSTNSGDWVETFSGSEIWEFTTSTNATDDRYVCVGLTDDEGASPPTVIDYNGYDSRSLTTFNTYGQSSWTVGDGASVFSKLIIFSDVNPVTKWGTIWYGESRDAAIKIINSTNIHINTVAVNQSATGIYSLVNDGSNKTITILGCLLAGGCQRGLWLDGNNVDKYEDISISGNMLICRGITFRAYGQFKGGEVTHNKFVYAIQSDLAIVQLDSVVGEAADKLDFRNNFIGENGFIGHTDFYATELSGFTLEGLCKNIDVHALYISGLTNTDTVGVVENGGCTGVKIWSNRITGYETGFRLSNPAGVSTTDLEIINNQVEGAKIGISLDATVDLGAIDVRNTIFEGTNVAGSIGILQDAGAAATITADYNCVYNFATSYSGLSAGANDVATDPQIEQQYGKVSGASDCYESGDVTVLPLTDNELVAHQNPINMGAFSTLEPLMTVGREEDYLRSVTTSVSGYKSNLDWQKIAVVYNTNSECTDSEVMADWYIAARGLNPALKRGYDLGGRVAAGDRDGRVLRGGVTGNWDGGAGHFNTDVFADFASWCTTNEVQAVILSIQIPDIIEFFGNSGTGGGGAKGSMCEVFAGCHRWVELGGVTINNLGDHINVGGPSTSGDESTLPSIIASETEEQSYLNFDVLWYDGKVRTKPLNKLTGVYRTGESQRVALPHDRDYRLASRPFGTGNPDRYLAMPCGRIGHPPSSFPYDPDWDAPEPWTDSLEDSKRCVADALYAESQGHKANLQKGTLGLLWTYTSVLNIHTTAITCSLLRNLGYPVGIMYKPDANKTIEAGPAFDDFVTSGEEKGQDLLAYYNIDIDINYVDFETGDSGPHDCFFSSGSFMANTMTRQSDPDYRALRHSWTKSVRPARGWWHMTETSYPSHSLCSVLIAGGCAGLASTLEPTVDNTQGQGIIMMSVLRGETLMEGVYQSKFENFNVNEYAAGDPLYAPYKRSGLKMTSGVEIK